MAVAVVMVPVPAVALVPKGTISLVCFYNLDAPMVDTEGGEPGAVAIARAPYKARCGPKPQLLLAVAPLQAGVESCG